MQQARREKPCLCHISIFELIPYRPYSSFTLSDDLLGRLRQVSLWIVCPEAKLINRDTEHLMDCSPDENSFAKKPLDN
jgi:hypothetical protein